MTIKNSFDVGGAHVAVCWTIRISAEAYAAIMQKKLEAVAQGRRLSISDLIVEEFTGELVRKAR